MAISDLYEPTDDGSESQVRKWVDGWMDGWIGGGWMGGWIKSHLKRNLPGLRWRACERVTSHSDHSLLFVPPGLRLKVLRRHHPL